MTTLILQHEDLGQGSYFESGLVLDFDKHTFQEFSAFTCNCSEEAMLERWATEYYEEYEDPEEVERLLTHDQLVDEYLDQYSNDPTIEGLTFTEWLELVAPVRPVDINLDEDEGDQDARDL